jgi:hypothetical protein
VNSKLSVDVLFSYPRYLNRYMDAHYITHIRRADEACYLTLNNTVKTDVQQNYIVKSACKGTQGTEFFSVADRFHVLQVLDVWTLRTTDHPD